MFTPLDIPFEYWIEHVIFVRLYVMIGFSSRIFYREIPCFAIDWTDCPCRVWCGLTTCLLFLGPLCGSQVWNDSGCVSLTWWRPTFPWFLIMFCIYLHASQYDHAFRLPHFNVSKSASFLQCTLVLSFYIDMIFTLSIGNPLYRVSFLYVYFSFTVALRRAYNLKIYPQLHHWEKNPA